MNSAPQRVNDWDFFIGSWRVHHRRLRERLVGCKDWLEFEGTTVCQKILGGAGNMDDNVLELPKGPYRAVTLRAYDATKGTWSIWWLDSRAPGNLDPPLVGQFENGIGIFYSDHTFNGRPIRVRFRWTNLKSGSPRWEQAFSDDDGKSWEINWTMDFTAADGTTCCPVVELRQYTLKSGARDTLIDLFEKEFIESQEEIGMRVIGTFRDLENPDRFVWLRGFQDMESRANQLQQFYGGPIWKEHREAANSTMIDSDNVLLLRPVNAVSGFYLPDARPAGGSAPKSSGLIIATIYHLQNGAEAEFAEFFRDTIAPILAKNAIQILGTFITEHHANTFPALPVREDANVFVWFARFPDRATFEAQTAASADEIAAKYANRVEEKPDVLFLAPTARSLLRA